MLCKLIWWLLDANFTPVGAVMEREQIMRASPTFFSHYYFSWSVCSHEPWKKIKPTVLEMEHKFQASYRWQQVTVTSLMLFWQQCARLDGYQELPSSLPSLLFSTQPAVCDVTSMGKKEVVGRNHEKPQWGGKQMYWTRVNFQTWWPPNWPWIIRNQDWFCLLHPLYQKWTHVTFMQR